MTVNQVLEIMLRWLEVNDWEKAFLSVIPKRKLTVGQNENEQVVTDSEKRAHEDEVEEIDEYEEPRDGDDDDDDEISEQFQDDS